MDTTDLVMNEIFSDIPIRASADSVGVSVPMEADRVQIIGGPEGKIAQAQKIVTGTSAAEDSQSAQKVLQGSKEHCIH